VVSLLSTVVSDKRTSLIAKRGLLLTILSYTLSSMASLKKQAKPKKERPKKGRLKKMRKRRRKSRNQKRNLLSSKAR